MITLFRFILIAIISWIAGLLFIAGTLYFANGGADFTVTDLMGFGVLTLVASGVLMLGLYLPSLVWLKRRRGGARSRAPFVLLSGIICNLPIFALLAFLINRKMSPSEALGFMSAFFVIGSTFGWMFNWLNRTNRTH